MISLVDQNAHVDLEKLRADLLTLSSLIIFASTIHCLLSYTKSLMHHFSICLSVLCVFAPQLVVP